MRVPTWMYLLLFVGLLVGNVKVYQTISAEPVLKVTVLEAGKTNAVLIKSPSGRIILVDTGSDASILRALGESLPVWKRDINAVILTSSAASSAGGLPAIEDRYRVSKLIRIGGNIIPYGTFFIFDGSRIEISASATFSISYGATSFKIYSSTPVGVYISDGQTIK